MAWIRILFNRCVALFRKQELDEDLDEELRTHLDLAAEENMQRGLPEHEARTAALRTFGGIAQAKEDYRMLRGLPFFEVFFHDLRFGFRQLRKSPGFVWMTISIFGLGIGITTAAFSAIDGVLLRPLPYQDPDRLVWIHDGMTQQDRSGWSACMQDFLLWQARSKSFLMGAFAGWALLLAGIGIYGVMAYSVLRRTREIALRMALGATRSSVVSIVLKSVLMQTAIGLSLGIPIAFVAGRLISSQLYETNTYDPFIFVGTTLALVICSLMAGVIPARRAALIDPMQALRTQ
jgi:hypothetical protein